MKTNSSVNTRRSFRLDSGSLEFEVLVQFHIAVCLLHSLLSRFMYFCLYLPM